MTSDDTGTDAGIAAMQEIDDRSLAAHALREVRFDVGNASVEMVGPGGQRQRAARAYGVREDANGKVRIQVVAPIRVTTPLAKLPEVLAVIAAWQRRTYLVVAGAVVAGTLASFVFTWLRQIPQAAPPPIPVAAANVPCLIARLNDASVVCRQGATEATVAAGQFFPGGVARLESVDRAAQRFVVMHMPSSTRVSFQVDPRALPANLEMQPK